MSIVRYDCFENEADFVNVEKSNRKKCKEYMQNYEAWELPTVTNPMVFNKLAESKC